MCSIKHTHTDTLAMLLFSDLHLSPKTFDTCMQVLRKVHDEAKRLDVPVGFLGDFYDKVYSQGTLPVDILNELLRYFSDEWTVPMIMIPGNHDYFDAAETEHGLTPFSFANPKCIRVIDTPTMVGTQLWIPWRRDLEVLKSILSTYAHANVIFAHLDLVGFRLNATKISTEGLLPSQLPSGVPVYTGHYHTPQSHGSIQYVGSPYQLSLSEAEDKKALLVLDDHWHVSSKIPLDIGPRQFKWTVNELLTRHESLRSWDRVSVTCAQTDLIQPLVTTLREQSVEIQVKRPSLPTKTRVDNQHQMTPVELWNAYGQRSGIDVQSTSWKRVTQHLKTIPVRKSMSVANPVHPKSLEVSGFGPFETHCTLTLDASGFTLVTGECDSTRGRSNGAGKSMATAGAWLWACTGQIDGRGALSFDINHSVIHHNAKEARVSVMGTTTDGQPWSIERRLQKRPKPPHKHALHFTINHVDRTRATLSATQKAIATELFGLDMSGSALHDWLLRHSVWSQQGVTRWLDATDTQAKKELYDIANMHVWITLQQWAKKAHQDAKRQHAVKRQQLVFRKDAARDAQKNLERIKEQASEWQKAHDELIEQLQSKLTDMENSFEKLEASEPVESCLAKQREVGAIETEMKDARMCLSNMQARTELLRSKIPKEWIEKDIEKEELCLRHLDKPCVEDAKQRLDQTRAEKRARKMQLTQKRSEFDEFKAQGSCSACGRAFEKDESHLHHMNRLDAQCTAARKHFTDANKNAVDAEQKWIHAKEKHAIYTTTLEHIQNVKSYRSLLQRTEKTEKELERIEISFIRVRKQLQDMQRRYDIYKETERLRKQLECALDEHRRILQRESARECPFDQSEDVVNIAKEALEKAEQEATQSDIMLEESTVIQKWTGPCGIQTYAMEHILKRLAAFTTDWLQKFFERDDIFLQVEFNEKEKLIRRVVCDAHKGIMSGGQWRRAQLASFMAWRELSSVQFPLLVMDEACTSMDTVGIRAVQKTLRQWCDNDPQRSCYFITHEPEQHRDTSAYHTHVKILHKRGRSSIVQASQAKRARLESKNSL